MNGENNILEVVAKATYETVDFKEEHYNLISKMNGLYVKKLEKYINSKPVVEFNFLEWLKTQTVGITTKAEFASVLNQIINTIKSKRNRTRIENIELRLTEQIVHDVIQGFGNEYELDSGKVKVNYDDQIVAFESFLKQKEQEKLQENEQENVN